MSALKTLKLRDTGLEAAFRIFKIFLKYLKVFIVFFPFLSSNVFYYQSLAFLLFDFSA